MRRNLADQSGSALVITLLVVVMLTVTVTDFLYATWIDKSLAAGFRDNTSAMEAVRSGVEAGRALLIEDRKKDARSKILIDHLGEDWALPSIPIPISGTYVFLTVMDESAKIDLNRLAGDRMAEKLRPILRRLLYGLDMDGDIADAITDWIDIDDEGAAEDGYYQSLNPPYPCKNGKLDSLEEIKRIRGVTPVVFGVLKKFVTIHSMGKINLNTAHLRIIEALHEEISQSMAEAVIEARNSAPFRTTIDIKTVSGFNDAIYLPISSIIDVKSESYFVYAVAKFNEVTRMAQAVFKERTENGAKMIYFRII
ncbi:MAG: type II secretion system protein K [bacterium]|nr:MAG: type II secretion system protein K [bacterium]